MSSLSGATTPPFAKSRLVRLGLGSWTQRRRCSLTWLPASTIEAVASEAGSPSTPCALWPRSGPAAGLLGAGGGRRPEVELLDRPGYERFDAGLIRRPRSPFLPRTSAIIGCRGGGRHRPGAAAVDAEIAAAGSDPGPVPNMSRFAWWPGDGPFRAGLPSRPPLSSGASPAPRCTGCCGSSGPGAPSATGNGWCRLSLVRCCPDTIDSA
jgi:hypothetical protein